jgi:hypothetical protein
VRFFRLKPNACAASQPKSILINCNRSQDTPPEGAAMNDERLTEELACHLMGWRLAPDRFMKSGRSWIPRWRFTPLTSLEHAFQLLDRAASKYTLTAVAGVAFTAEVRVRGRMGKVSGLSKAKTISLALAQALELELPDDVGVQASAPVHRRSPRSRSKNDGI